MRVLGNGEILRCDKCEGTCKPVHAHGPIAPILVIGEAPGQWEVNSGKPFCGDAGKELDNTYLPRAKLSRREVRTANVVLCQSKGNKKPNDSLISSCSKFHIPQDIEDCDPEIIVLMGAVACSLLPTINLEIEHGRPIRVDTTLSQGTVFEQWGKCGGGYIVPMYHPAAGLHTTGTIQAMVEDWQYFGEWRGKDPTLPYHYKKSYDCDPIYVGDYNSGGTAIDLESVDGYVWSIQVCTAPGKVSMFTVPYLTALKLSGEFSGILNWLQSIMSSPIYLHNAPGDLVLLKQLGFTPESLVVDTMQKAYHRQNLPQGLKAIGYRLFGIRMTEYKDLVIPYSKRALEDWLMNALVFCEDNLRWTEFKQLKTKIKEIAHISEQEKFTRRILGHSISKETYDPWERLDTHHMDFSRIVDQLGYYPTPSIEHVPKRLAIDYACTDADVTYQFKEWLIENRETGMGIDECDLDAGSM